MAGWLEQQAILDLVVGGRCPGCSRAGSPRICERCQAAVRALPPAEGAAFLDAGVVARLIRVAKRGDWRQGGRCLAQLAIERDRAWLCRHAWDAITFVPPDPVRRAARGGHLPERYAAAMGAELGLPVVQLLHRRRGRSQRGLGRDARIRNVAHAFHADPSAMARFGPLPRILLLDDVRTTGATSYAAAAALEPRVRAVDCRAIAGVARRAQRSGPSGVETHGYVMIRTNPGDRTFPSVR